MPCCESKKYNKWCKDLPVVDYKDEEGKEYCVFHAPQGRKGVSVKDFNKLVFKRINEAKKEGRNCNLSGTIFEDIKFRQFNENNPLPDINFSDTIFSGDAEFLEVEFNGDVDFSAATFNKKADLRATFNKDANFPWTEFIGEATFAGAKFNGLAYFSEAKFRECALFLSAKFKALTTFSKSIFNEEAEFRGATFNWDAYFTNAIFGEKADFSDATFSGEANFSGANFSGKADFTNATFSKVVDFAIATFSGKADFTGATFREYANFTNATFSGRADFHVVTFSKGVDFVSATFSEYANFSYTTFSKNAYFSSATFSGRADFHVVTFIESAFFNNKTFNKDGDFRHIIIKDKIRFDGANLRNICFLETDLSNVDFINCIWNKKHGRKILYDENLLFKEIIDEHNETQAGDEIAIKTAERLKRLLKQRLKKLKQRFKGNPSEILRREMNGFKKDISFNKKGLKKVEILYRRLKQKYKDEHDDPEVSDWHYGEKEMFRKGSFFRRYFPFSLSNLYWFSSGYGERPLRAGVMLVWLIIAISILFGLTGIKPVDGSNIIEIKQLTDIWDIDYLVATLQYATFETRPDFIPVNSFLKIAAKLLIPLQTALFALAVRNRFRR